MHIRSTWVVAGAFLCAAPFATARAQEVRGVVPPPPSTTRKSLTVVTLLDSAGNRVESSVARADGSFRFRLPAPGTYALRFDALRILSNVTPPFVVADSQTISYEHAWTDDATAADEVAASAQDSSAAGRSSGASRDSAQRLRGVRVEGRPEPERFFGLDVRSLAIRPIAAERIDSLAKITTDFPTLLRLLAVPGLRTFAPTGTRVVCAVTPGVTTRPQGLPCSEVVVDGMKMPWPFDITLIDPQTVERVILLRPMEATQFYGTSDGAGMLVIVTKAGRATRSDRDHRDPLRLRGTRIADRAP